MATPDGEGRGQQHGRPADVVLGPDGGDGGQHRAGARDEDQPEAEAEHEPAALGAPGVPRSGGRTAARAGPRRPGRGARAPSTPSTTMPDPPQQVRPAGRGRSRSQMPTRVATEKLRTRPATTANGRRRRRAAASSARASAPGSADAPPGMCRARRMRRRRPGPGRAVGSVGAGRARPRRPALDQAAAAAGCGARRPVASSRPLAAPDGEDHRQHRQDARRDPGHQPAQEPDQEQDDHRPSLPRRVGREQCGRPQRRARPVGRVRDGPPTVVPAAPPPALHGGADGSGRRAQPRRGHPDPVGLEAVGEPAQLDGHRGRARRCPGWSAG